MHLTSKRNSQKPTELVTSRININITDPQSHFYLKWNAPRHEANWTWNLWWGIFHTLRQTLITNCDDYIRQLAIISLNTDCYYKQTYDGIALYEIKLNCDGEWTSVMYLVFDGSVAFNIWSWLSDLNNALPIRHTRLINLVFVWTLGFVYQRHCFVSDILIFTARNSSCEKVVFSQGLCGRHSQADTPPPGENTELSHILHYILSDLESNQDFDQFVSVMTVVATNGFFTALNLYRKKVPEETHQGSVPSGTMRVIWLSSLGNENHFHSQQSQSRWLSTREPWWEKMSWKMLCLLNFRCILNKKDIWRGLLLAKTPPFVPTQNFLHDESLKNPGITAYFMTAVYPTMHCSDFF